MLLAVIDTNAANKISNEYARAMQASPARIMSASASSVNQDMRIAPFGDQNLQDIMDFDNSEQTMSMSRQRVDGDDETEFNDYTGIAVKASKKTKKVTTKKTKKILNQAGGSDGFDSSLPPIKPINADTDRGGTTPIKDELVEMQSDIFASKDLDG